MHDLLHDLVEWSTRLLEQMGMWGLFVFSFTESLFHPIPVDPVILTMSTMGEWSVWDIFFWATLGSVLGGMMAHFLGKHLGKPLFVKFFGEKRFIKGKNFMEKWGAFGVIIVAITPLPYKVIAWVAGILHMPLWKFTIATIIGRGVRFGLVLGGLEVIKNIF